MLRRTAGNVAGSRALLLLVIVLTVASCGDGQHVHRSNAPGEHDQDVLARRNVVSGPRLRPGPAVSATLRTGSPLAARPEGAEFLYSATQARRASRRLSSTVPHAPGVVDEFDYGTLAPAYIGDVEDVIEYRAACEWYVAAVAHGVPAQVRKDARDIAIDVPHWPTFRDDRTRRHIAAQVARTLLRGRSQFLVSYVLRNCHGMSVR
jgi:hypothetical protein